MSRRLYLRDGERYRVRRLSGFVVAARWDDVRAQFALGRGTQRRAIDLDGIAEAQHMARQGCPRRWYALDACYRARHEPRVSVPWVHPYRARVTA